MDIGIRLHDVQGEGLEQKLRAAHDQGFTCAHLAMSKVMGEQYMRRENLDRALGMSVAETFKKEGMRVAVLGCYLNLAHPDKAVLKDTQEKYLAHLDVLEGVGQGVVGTETGAPNAEYAFDASCHTDKALDIFMQGLLPVAEYADKLGVTLAIEPVVRHIVYDAKRARKVLDTLRCRRLKIILDPVNLLDVWNVDRRDYLVDEALELLMDDIVTLHVKDYVLQNGQMVVAPIGTGAMQWGKIIKRIGEKHPDICATLEDTLPQNAQREGAYIRALL